MTTTREHILQAATELFARQGFARTSIREVADLAGANSALIYYYFGSKAELYRLVLSEPAQQLLDLLQQALSEGGTARERLDRFVRAWVRFIMTRVGLTPLVTRSLASGDEEVVALVREWMVPTVNLLVRTVEEGVQGGEFRPVDARLAVGSLVGMGLFFATSGRMAPEILGLDPGEELVERLAAHTSDVFLRGIEA